jgi:RNA polymerase sigma factor (sigma-70 family)
VSNYEAHSDGALLMEFISSDQDAAFTEIVSRHGSMVYGICMRILGRSHDAEEAAQAAFHTLALNASKLSNHPSIVGWLHHVAWNVSMNARRSVETRRIREQEAVAEMPQSTPFQNAEWEQLKPLLDSELNALPEKYRIPLILHHIEGRTQEEIANLLSCKPSTVSMRLTRGRQKLKNRLKKCGLCVAIGMLGELMSKNASAAMPETLVSKTAQAAKFVVTHKEIVGETISAKVAALTQGIEKMLYLKKIKSIATIVLATILPGIVVAYFICQFLQSRLYESSLDTLPAPEHQHTNAAPNPHHLPMHHHTP